MMMAMPRPRTVVVMDALPAKAGPEAAGFGGLRRRDPGQQGDGGQRTQDELHLTPRDLSRSACKNACRRPKFQRLAGDHCGAISLSFSPGEKRYYISQTQSLDA